MDSPADEATAAQKQQQQQPTKGSAFWLSFAAILVAVLLSALDLTAVSTALPTITADLNGGDDFVWVGSAYALSSTAILPLSGTLANIFGRRPVVLLCVLIFALGSALSGAAQSMNMLIGARTVQGIGGGGILNLTDVIVSDLVPLADRGMYQGMIALTWAFACGIGPPIGGALAQKATWRWLFYINLPLSGLAFALLLLFLRVRTPEGSVMTKLKRVDWFGNLIIIAGTTLAITGLTFAGIRFPWGSAKVLAPLIIGLVLILVFIFYEKRVPEEPTIPWEVLNNATTLSGYVSTFAHGIVSVAIIYYLPVYFQATQGVGPIRSGVELFPTALLISPFAMIAGASTQIWGKYRPANIAGWVFLTAGVGVLSLLRADSTTAQWVGYQVLPAAGAGLLFPGTMFPILAPLPVEHNAAAIAFFSFVRSFAQTWGITISGTILQNQLKKSLPAAFIAQFPSGVEIAYAAIPKIGNLEEPLRTEVRVAFAQSMSIIWKSMVGISGLGVISLFFLKEVKMISHTDSNYGLADGAAPSGVDQEKGEGAKPETTVIASLA